MTTENVLQNKFPRQLFFGALAFLAANTCIIVLNMDKFLIASAYAIACLLCYLSCYWGYGISKFISAFLLFITIILNFFGKPILSIPIYQVVIAAAGILFALISYFYLFSNALSKWFDSRFSIRQEKRIKKYTEKEFQNFVEIQKTIPRSYVWGKWVVLFTLIVSLLQFSELSITSGLHEIFYAIQFIFLIIGFVSLMIANDSVIKIYILFIFLQLFFITCFLLILLYGVVIKNAGIAGLHEFWIGALSVSTNATSAIIENAAGQFCAKLLPTVAIWYVFLNKKSRAWLKAKRITRGMLNPLNN